MSCTELQQSLEDVENLVKVLGSVVIAVSVMSSIVVIVMAVFMYRILKQMKQIRFNSNSTRVDIRKILDNVESAVKRNPIVEEDIDGSHRASPIFTRRLFGANPLPFDLSILRESEEEKNEPNDQTTGNGTGRKLAPSVPPRRSQSFYGGY